MNWVVLLFVAVLLLALPGGYLLWLRLMARRPAPEGTVVTQFEPPRELGPAEAGYLLDGRLRPRTIAAVLADLVNRGVLILISWEDSPVYGLELKAAAAELAPAERLLVERLFAGGDTVSVKLAADRFAAVRLRLEDAVHRELRRSGLVKPPGLTAPLLVFFAATAAFVLAIGLLPFIGVLGAVAVWAALTLLVQLAYVYARRWPRLTESGQRKLAELYGFRAYLAAEIEHLRFTEREEGKIDRFTPYAAVFGLSWHWPTELQEMTKAFLGEGPPPWSQ